MIVDKFYSPRTADNDYMPCLWPLCLATFHLSWSHTNTNTDTHFSWNITTVYGKTEKCWKGLKKGDEGEKRGVREGNRRSCTLCVYCSSTPGENSMTQSDERATVLASLNWDAGDIKNPLGVVYVCSLYLQAKKEPFLRREDNIVDTTRPQSRGSLLSLTVILGHGSLKAPWISRGPASTSHTVNASPGSRGGRREPATGHLIRKPNIDRLEHWFHQKEILQKRRVVSQPNRIKSRLLFCYEEK